MRFVDAEGRPLPEVTVTDLGSPLQIGPTGPARLDHLGVLRLKKGDMLVYTTEPGQHWTQAAWARLGELLTKVIAHTGVQGVKWMIAEGGTLGVVRKAEPVKLIIEPDGDEVVRYTLETVGGPTLLIEANHDDDGWAGMDRIRDALTKLAKTVGVEIEDRT